VGRVTGVEGWVDGLGWGMICYSTVMLCKGGVVNTVLWTEMSQGMQGRGEGRLGGMGWEVE
jgi:hypothetical protein